MYKELNHMHTHVTIGVNVVNDIPSIGDNGKIIQFGSVLTSISCQHGPQPDMDCSTNICTLCIPQYQCK